MEVPDTQLAERYASLSTIELVDLFNLDTLTQQARSILDKELESRGVDPGSYKPEEKAQRSDDTSTQKKSKTTFLKRFWKGEIPLVYSFWLVWVLGGLVVMLGSGRIYLESANLLLSRLIFIAYTVFATIPVWRSAKNYSGKVIWRNGEQAVIIL